MTFLDYDALHVAQAPPEPHCDGTGEFVRAEDTDGAGVTRCPSCKRVVVTEPMDDEDHWRYVRWHRTLDQQRAITAAAKRGRIVHSRDEDGVPEDMDEVSW